MSAYTEVALLARNCSEGRVSALAAFCHQSAFEKRLLAREAARVTLSRILPVRAPRSERRCFPNRPLVTGAAKVPREPTPDLLILCCVRSQRENFGNSENFYALARR
jgi:hypothetical protein